MSDRDRPRSGGPSDPDAGIWHGRSVARRFVSPDGLTVLVGRSDRDNDLLTWKLAAPRDFWFHVAGHSGSHVLVRNPEGLDHLPRETRRFAAALAARYSKAGAGGRVAVHGTTRAEIRRPKGAAAGKVALRKYDSLQVSPAELDPT